MPRLAPKDIIHAAITDHRIVRRPGADRNNAEPGEETLVAPREPPVRFRKRDLGLAELELGSRRGLPTMREAGIRLLEALPEEEKNADAAVLSALAAAKLSQGMVAEGVALSRAAAARQPANALYAFYLAIALAKSNDPAGAEQQLSRALELDPSLQQPYIELCSMYARQGRLRDVAATIDRYLKWNPQSISFRFERPKIGEK